MLVSASQRHILKLLVTLRLNLRTKTGKARLNSIKAYGTAIRAHGLYQVPVGPNVLIVR